ncbi:MAG: NTP transferase domain-containing protein [Candidatus Cloacimonetes bacterium]|nr:NTP transferase domain-containing protein [Candidatus Cloacimonadota bacterium]
MKALAAIVLAAGKGTRMKSERAKVTFPLAGKAMVQRVVDTALKLKASKIAVIVGWKKESVVLSLNPDPSLEFIEQTEQLGTGHAVMVATDSFQNFDGDVLILCGDVPLLTAETVDKLWTAHKEKNAAATVLTAIVDDAGRYGRMLRDSQGNIKGIVEYKDASEEERKIQEFNTGIYCYDSKKLFAALAKVTNNNQQKEYYLTDTLEILYNAGESVESVVLDDIMEVSGVNSQEQLAELEDIYYDKIRKHWLNNGVMIHNPDTVLIGDDVSIGQDSEIGSGSQLFGDSCIGRECIIGPNCLIQDSVLGAGSVLLGHNIVIESELRENSISDYGNKVIRNNNDG